MARLGNKVAVGISGGVDSSVAAYLLKQQGYEVIGVFMKNFDPLFFFDEKMLAASPELKTGCHWQTDQEDARAVCQKLGIPFLIWNFEAEYYQEVMDYFFQEYATGRTPNPDIVCNKKIKFGVFLNKAKQELGVDYIATGHYARVEKREAEYLLLKGVDQNKDQSYFLYAIDQSVLSQVLFPLGNLNKEEVRDIAKRIDLPTKDKKDSQGICFVGEVDMRKFLLANIKPQPGEIVDWDTGQVVGQHQGLFLYTIGQRRGIGQGGVGIPYYVAAKDLERNILYVVKGAHHPKLFKQEVVVKDVNWISANQPDLPLSCQAKIRYRQADQECQVDIYDDNKLIVKFNKPQRAVTPGQSLVLYQGDVCLGGGVIVDY